jgi:hypothetical protein
VSSSLRIALGCGIGSTRAATGVAGNHIAQSAAVSGGSDAGLDAAVS